MKAEDSGETLGAWCHDFSPLASMEAFAGDVGSLPMMSFLRDGDPPTTIRIRNPYLSTSCVPRRENDDSFTFYTAEVLTQKFRLNSRLFRRFADGRFRFLCFQSDEEVDTSNTAISEEFGLELDFQSRDHCLPIAPTAAGFIAGEHCRRHGIESIQLSVFFSLELVSPRPGSPEEPLWVKKLRDNIDWTPPADWTGDDGVNSAQEFEFRLKEANSVLFLNTANYFRTFQSPNELMLLMDGLDWDQKQD